jgi:hypothetical protein
MMEMGRIEEPRLECKTMQAWEGVVRAVVRLPVLEYDGMNDAPDINQFNSPHVQISIVPDEVLHSPSVIEEAFAWRRGVCIGREFKYLYSLLAHQ